MRAMVIDGFGGPDQLQWGEVPKPVPGPGEVLVKIAYAAVNPADWKTREGMLSKYIDYRFPFVLGFDLAGTVEAIGPGVSQWRPGDRVFGTSRQGQGLNGSYAEFAIASATLLATIPDTISDAEAAGLPTAGTTAFGGMVDVGAARAGQSVLVNGGAGGVGSIAIQIAVAQGAKVAATCGPGNIDYVMSLGADLAIDYRNGSVVQAIRKWAPDGVDLVLDAVGQNSLLPQAIDLVKPGGSFVEIETLISEASPAEKAAAADKGVRIVSNMIAIERLPQHLAGLAELVAAGKVRPPATVEMPLAEVAEAHRLVQAGHVRGKIALKV